MTVLTRSKTSFAFIEPNLKQVSEAKKKDISEWFIATIKKYFDSADYCRPILTRVIFFNRVRIIQEEYYFINAYLGQAIENSSKDFSKFVVVVKKNINKLFSEINGKNLQFKAKTPEEKKIIKELLYELYIAEKTCEKCAVSNKILIRRSPRLLTKTSVNYKEY